MITRQIKIGKFFIMFPVLQFSTLSTFHKISTTSERGGLHVRKQDTAGNALVHNYLAQIIIFCNLHLYLIFSSSPTNCR